MDPHNWGVYSVMPEGFDNSKAKYQLSDDDRAIRHLGKYYRTAESAIMAAQRLLVADDIECPECTDLLAALEAHEAEVSRLADEIGRAVLKLEAAR